MQAHGCSYSMPPLKQQRGTVLIMVLLIVAVVTALAVNFSSAFQLSLARGEVRWHGAQASAYLQGAEELAIKFLQDDRANNEIDHLEEDWAQEASPFPVEGGWLLGRIVDAQGLFNLNSLAGNVDAGRSGAERFTPSQRRFIRLLQTFENMPVSENEAVALMEAIIDWLDADDEPTGFGGAESGFYSSQELAYHPANQLFSSVSELRLLRHMNPSLYKVLAPVVVVLPEATDININTATLPVFQSLNVGSSLSPLAAGDAQQLLEARGSEGYEDLQDFVDSPSLAGLLAEGALIETDNLSVNSEYFLIYSQAQLARQRRQSMSLVYRTENDTQIIRREDG